MLWNTLWAKWSAGHVTPTGLMGCCCRPLRPLRNARLLLTFRLSKSLVANFALGVNREVKQ